MQWTRDYSSLPFRAKVQRESKLVKHPWSFWRCRKASRSGGIRSRRAIREKGGKRKGWRGKQKWVVRSIRVGWHVGRFSCASTQNGEGVLVVLPPSTCWRVAENRTGVSIGQCVTGDCRCGVRVSQWAASGRPGHHLHGWSLPVYPGPLVHVSLSSLSRWLSLSQVKSKPLRYHRPRSFPSSPLVRRSCVYISDPTATGVRDRVNLIGSSPVPGPHSCTPSFVLSLSHQRGFPSQGIS